MTLTSRQTKILDSARSQNRIFASQLADDLSVAVQTIRRDIRKLCALGHLERIHGGATLASSVGNIGYGDRRALNSNKKNRIAKAAAALIPDNASLFLNIGTTTEAVARALFLHKNLVVITNNLNVANILAEHPSCDVVVTGGRLRRSDGGLTGDLAARAIERFKVDLAVIGASAIDSDGDLLDFDPEEVRLSRQIIDSARTTVVVCDSTKFGRKAPVKIGSLSESRVFVTDAVHSERLVNLCSDWKTTIQLA